MEEWIKIFNKNIERPEDSDCHIWTGYCVQGQPAFFNNGLKDARCVIWEHYHDTCPEQGLLPKCGEPLCVNVEHMVAREPVEEVGQMKFLLLNNITRNLDVQPREYMRTDVIKEYAEAYKEGAAFPPVIVFFDGHLFWLADGFHRVEAAEKAGLKKIRVDLREGTKRDAILYAASTNYGHGLRRSSADKQRIIKWFLQDEEWSKWSNREIAKQCKVDHKTVGKYRRELAEESVTGEFPSYEDQGSRKVQRGGTIYEMDVSNIGKSDEPEDEFEEELIEVTPQKKLTLAERFNPIAENIGLPQISDHYPSHDERVNVFMELLETDRRLDIINWWGMVMYDMFIRSRE